MARGRKTQGEEALKVMRTIQRAIQEEGLEEIALSEAIELVEAATKETKEHL